VNQESLELYCTGIKCLGFVTGEILVASVDLIPYPQYYNALTDLSTTPTLIPGLWMSQDSVSQPMDRDEFPLADPIHEPTTVKIIIKNVVCKRNHMQWHYSHVIFTVTL